MGVPIKLIQKIKIEFLTTKFILLVLLLLTTSVFSYEAVKLHQFNKYIIQVKEEKESEDYQKASETFQKAKDVLSATLFLKSLKKEEVEEIDNEIEEIKKLAEEKVKGDDSPMVTSSSTTVPTTTIENDNDENVDEEATATPSPTPTPEPTEEPTSFSIPEPKAEEMQTCPTLSDKYATIINLEDSKGNVQRQSAHNNCPPSHGEFIVKNGETITVSVSVDNKKSDPVLYEFIGSGFPNRWQSSNSTTVIIDDKYESVHLRVFVKNSDDKFRAPDYDDMIQVSYKVVN